VQHMLHCFHPRKLQAGIYIDRMLLLRGEAEAILSVVRIASFPSVTRNDT